YQAVLTHHNGRRLLLVQADRRAALLDVRTGQPYADIPPLGGVLLHALGDGPGVVLGQVDERRGEKHTSSVWAQSPLTGAPLWEATRKTRDGVHTFHDQPVQAPVFLEDDIVSGLPDPVNIGLQVLDAATGKVRWQRTFCPSWPADTPGDLLPIRFALHIEPRLGGEGQGIVLA